MDEVQALVDRVWCCVLELVDALETLEAELGCKKKDS